ncbi:MAG: hypothetical protein IPL88_00600 [Rhizobiales bacterium]|nr:hypothetical protein [Hyphomicrobiales bacterium]
MSFSISSGEDSARLRAAAHAHRHFSIPGKRPDDARPFLFVIGATGRRDAFLRKFPDYQLAFVVRGPDGALTAETLALMRAAEGAVCVVVDRSALRAAPESAAPIEGRTFLATRSPLALIGALEGRGGKRPAHEDEIWLHPLDPAAWAGGAPLAVEDEDARLTAAAVVEVPYARPAGAQGLPPHVEALIVGPAIDGPEDAAATAAAVGAALRRAGVPAERAAFLPNPLALERGAAVDLVAERGVAICPPVDLAVASRIADRVVALDPLTARLVAAGAPGGAVAATVDLIGRPVAGWADLASVKASAARARCVDNGRAEPSPLAFRWIDVACADEGEAAFFRLLYKLEAAPPGLFAKSRVAEARPTAEARAAYADDLALALETMAKSRGVRSRVVQDALPQFERLFRDAGDLRATALAAANAVAEGTAIDAMRRVLEAVGGTEGLAREGVARFVAIGLWRNVAAAQILIDRATEVGQIEAAARLRASLADETRRRLKPPAPTRRVADSEAAELYEAALAAAADGPASPAAETLRRAADAAGPVASEAAALLRAQFLALAGDREAAAAALWPYAASQRAFDRCAGLLLRAGTFDAAVVEAVRTPLPAEAGDLEAQARMRLLLAADRMDEAHEALERGLAAPRARAEVLLCAFAEQANQRGAFAASEAALARLSPAQRARTRAAVAAADAFAGHGAQERVLEAVEAALAGAPASAALLTRKCAALEALGRDGELRAALELRLREDGERPSLVNQWAGAVERLGGSEAEILRLEALERVAGLAGRECAWLSALWAERGRIGEAYDWARRAFERRPASPQLAEFALAAARLASDREGVADLLAAAAAAGDDAPASVMRLVNLARAAGQGQGWREPALGALRREPTNAAFQLVAARNALDAADFGWALRHAEVAAALDPASADAYTVAALARLGEERHDDAEALAGIVRRMRPRRAAVYDTLGKIAEDAGRHALALERYGRAADLRAEAGEDPHLRAAWSIVTTAGILRDAPNMRRGEDLMRASLHAVTPRRLRAWNGESLAGKRVLFMNRGGPGDELRWYSGLFRELLRQAGEVAVVGDERVRRIFEFNYPGVRFIANPWAGRRFNRTPGPVAPGLSNSATPGSVELLRRLNAYVPAGAERDYDFLVWPEDCIRIFHFAGIETSFFAPGLGALDLPPEGRGAAEASLSALGPGLKVGIVWRNSYYSATRRPRDMLTAIEMAPVLAVPGVTFVDLHPVSFEEENEAIAQRTGVRLKHIEGVDMLNDFVGQGWALKGLDALVMPGVTQRDLAAAVGAWPIWSFTVWPGGGEAWRADPVTKADCWQKGIVHHTLLDYGSREAIVDALRDRVSRLASGRAA